MIISKETNPKFSLFYLGGLIINEIKDGNAEDLLDVYKSVKDKTNISFKLFILALDFLFLVDVIGIELLKDFKLD